ncbi:protein of unknown function (plasmid) [Magnetospirillum sp. XM-1]|uniref:hypothetical protein n=1 Tax=Magnetospirillum sp. XM-1 TaxID=1663591 RepID=UPI00073DF7D8|nr:hypothetical protein [Magnetospirillum sp. XM-1]CUW41928.1 protein of unknown function [Magnetospirillum sp. XM-1]
MSPILLGFILHRASHGCGRPWLRLLHAGFLPRSVPPCSRPHELLAPYMEIQPTDGRTKPMAASGRLRKGGKPAPVDQPYERYRSDRDEARRNAEMDIESGLGPGVVRQSLGARARMLGLIALPSGGSTLRRLLTLATTPPRTPSFLACSLARKHGARPLPRNRWSLAYEEMTAQEKLDLHVAAEAAS